MMLEVYRAVLRVKKKRSMKNAIVMCLLAMLAVACAKQNYGCATGAEMLVVPAADSEGVYRHDEGAKQAYERCLREQKQKD